MHSPAITDALVIYTAPTIATTNSFAALNCNIPDGLGNEDVQEDLLARASLDLQLVVSSPQDSLDSPRNQHDQCYDTGVDGATASESKEEPVENFTNDPIPPDASVKPAKKRGRLKKGESIRKPSILPKYNTRSKISISEATAIASAVANSNFLVDDPWLASTAIRVGIGQATR